MNTEELTPEELKLVKELKALVEFKADCQRVIDWHFKNTKNVCVIENKDLKGFSNFTPALLANLLGMIKDGTLVFKKPRVKKESPEEKLNKMAQTYEKDCSDLIEAIKPHLKTFTPAMCNNFFSYWSEPLTKGTMKGRARYMEQKTWSIERRLSTWKGNQDNFKK